MPRAKPSRVEDPWKRPKVRAALKRADAGLRQVEQTTVFINQLPDPFERHLSWKYFLACRFDGHPFEFTHEGLRPVQQ